ncbi:MAG TPA: MFS transporter [Methylomirabilota bacterium]|nr:MFS transporter [Methylomirabilota bacterium]
MHDADAPEAGLAPARRAVSVCFFVNGAIIASWLPHIPDLKARLDLDDGGLGLLLLAMAAGAIAALPPAGWLVARAGSRAVIAASASALSAAVIPPALAPGIVSSAAALALLGACNATLDVAMNAHGVTVEERYRRPIMSSFHAFFSLGGLVGAALAGAAMAVGLSAAAHVAAVAALSLAAVCVATRRLLPTTRTRRDGSPIFVAPPRALLGLGLLTFCALLAEGAMGDWSAVYLRDYLGTMPSTAAMGFAAFSLAMALGRFSGDRLARRLGPRRLLQLSATLAASGLALSLLARGPIIVVLGFAVVGLGAANLIPVLFRAAGRVDNIPAGTAIAAVATSGYFGFLAGPPLIGFAARMAGLPFALGLVCAACALVAVGAAGTFTATDRPTASSPPRRT